jgi:hypothetical protein
VADDIHEEVKLDKRGLPPINRIKMPEMKVMSTRIRWLSEVGYLTREIAPFLGVRYQQVRNVMQNPPKRAAREDLPPLTVEILSVSEDNLELMDQHAMAEQVAASRAAHRKERKNINQKRRALTADDLENEALDDENYGRS